MSKEYLKIMLFGILCSAMCGCSALNSIKKVIFGEPEDTIDLEALAIYVDSEPRVRPGVALTIQVSVPGTKNSGSTAMEVLVDQKGEVTLPYLLTKPVKCDGLTLEAFRQKLVKSYQEYIKQPQVTVHFSAFDSRTGVSPYGTVMVLGEVGSPGPVNMPPTRDLTVLKALQVAGGLRPFANKRKIQVARCEKDGTVVKSTVDIEEIGEEGRIDKDMKLRAGDVVHVPEIYW